MNKGRVIAEHKTNYIVFDGHKELTATVKGSFFIGNNFPKVGDWILFTEGAKNKATINEILPRYSQIMRQTAESGEPQVIVANVNIIFIVMGLDNDFNLSRLERYLLLAKQSQVKPVILLNKSDLPVDLEAMLKKVKVVAGPAQVYAISATNGINMEILTNYLTADVTAVLLGSSGAGKSTITNWLLKKDVQKIGEVRGDDSRGRHTTTARQLFTLPTGAYLIDTPGMRELSIVESVADEEDTTFLKIVELSKQCKFSNCDHQKSKQCAVLSALGNGEVSERELASYLKIQQERLLPEKQPKPRPSKHLKKKRQKKIDDETRKESLFNI